GLSLKDLKVSSKVKLLADKLDELVVKIESPTKEEEEKPAEQLPTEGEETPKEEEKPTEPEK
ncbi:MAG: hypothetical protein U0946_00945, partial [Patescibacteria group bacterium]|nr:hypothetical protein [Patescibacteria group bacterium]